jgi:hypothetical protein
MTKTMMMKGAVAAILLIAAMLPTAFAQGPIQKRVDFNINVSFQVKVGSYMLPAGDYVLHQVSADDLNLFALYPGKSMRHSPVAMIRTVRVDHYASGRYPEKANIKLNIDESGNEATPVLRGWNVPGDDGWQVISVVPRHKNMLARATR